MDRNSHTETRAGLVSGSAAYLIWGALTIFWKLLDDFDAFELIGWRIVTALVLLLAVVAFQKNLRGVFAALRNPRLLARVAAASLLLVTNWTLYVWAVVNERIIETALGYFIAPIGTTLVGVLVLGEKLRPVQRAALVFAFASVAVITITYGRPPLLALAIAASWVIYGLLKKQVPLRPVDGLTAETIVLLIPALVLVLFSGLFTAVPLLCFAHAALRLPLTLIGPLQYLVPIINFVLGWAVYGEPLNGGRFTGFLLVWGGLVLTLVDTMRNRTTVESTTP